MLESPSRDEADTCQPDLSSVHRHIEQCLAKQLRVCARAARSERDPLREEFQRLRQVGGQQESRSTEMLRYLVWKRVQAENILRRCTFREGVRDVDKRAEVHGSRHDSLSISASGRAMAAERILRDGEQQQSVNLFLNVD